MKTIATSVDRPTSRAASLAASRHTTRAASLAARARGHVALLALGSLAALGLDARVEGSALAAPASLPHQAIDVELKRADVKSVFAMLGELGGKPVTLDPCVHGTVDIRLANTPLPLVYDALALKLGLAYEDRGDGIVVRCAASAASAPAPERPDPRVSLAVKGAALADVVDHLTGPAKLAGVDYQAATRPRVTMTLENVRLSTLLTALSDATGLRVTIAGDRLVVADK